MPLKSTETCTVGTVAISNLPTMTSSSGSHSLWEFTAELTGGVITSLPGDFASI
ncbi:MAG: hypothetical protein MUF15_08500 [Acidobacteria bacterium]|nr:hypothetical protein [Acidobacteriota bacterium]